VGAALALTAAAPATAAPHASSHAAQHKAVAHQATRKTHKFAVSGLAKSHHGRTLTLFATTEKVGGTVRHNRKVSITFAHGVRGKIKVTKGNHVHLVARGVGDFKRFTVHHNDDETVGTNPATLLFGTITQESGSLLVVAENDRDNGDHQDGDNDGDGGGHGGDDVRSHDHGPGGGGGDDGDHHDGHKIVVDTSSASTVDLDGSAGVPAVGDEVAVLGEVSNDTVVANAVYGFSTPQSFLRGEVRTISGSTVAVKAHGDTVLVNLDGVPLVVNGTTGSSTSDLTVGDKLLVIGSFSMTDNSFTPDLAFAFNGHDDHPCGHNENDG
jgi:hypothetical protein